MKPPTLRPLKSPPPPVLIPTLLALVLAVGMAWLAIQRLSSVRQDVLEAGFNIETGEMSLRVEERFKAYRQVLRSMRAFMLASERVTRVEWQQFVDSLRMQTDYPGIQGVGYAELIPASQLASHEARIRAEGFPDYRVSPPGVRDEYSAIVFLEPFDWRNQRAFGYDMYSEPVRHEAMARARQLGVPALSGKVRLIQETSSDTQAGVLLYLPVFYSGDTLDTPAKRDAAFRGWVYAPFRIGDLIAGTLGDAAPRVRLRIYDGHEENPETLLYDSHPGREEAPAIAQRRLMELDARVWTLVFEGDAAMAAQTDATHLEVAAVLLIGTLFVLLTYSFTAARLRARELAGISASLRASEARYSALVNLSREGIAALDARLCFSYVNPRLIELLGYPDHELIGKPIDTLWPEADRPRRDAVFRRLEAGEASSYEQMLRRADGRHLTVIISDAPDLDAAGKLRGVILTLTDISERKASEDRIHYLANHDTLTGLANRSMFMDQVNNALLVARRQHGRFALLFLDLDHFKEINDTFGHAAGDDVLITTATRMRQCLRASDLVARQGGDEFMVLLRDVKGKDHALAAAEKIRRAIHEPFPVGGAQLLVSISIGIALYPEHGDTLESLTQAADRAMYQAKNSGRNQALGAETPQPP